MTRAILVLFAVAAAATAGQDELQASNSGFARLTYVMGRKQNAYKFDGDVRTGAAQPGRFRLTVERGWAEWNLSVIPDTVIIDSAFCVSRCFEITAELSSVGLFDMENRPSQTQDPEIIYNDAGAGDEYAADPDPGIGWERARLSEAGRSAIQRSLAADWFALGYAGASNMMPWSIVYNGFQTDSGPRLEIYYSDPVPGHDVGCISLLAPLGQLDSGATVTPACSVYNFGLFTESYPVRMAIGAGYEEMAQVMAHEPATAQYVTFPDWTAAGRDRFSVTCSTELDGDNRPSNNAVHSFVDLLVRDVSASQVVVPGDTVSAGNVTPIATFRTTGNVRAPARVFFAVSDEGGGAVYSESLDLISGVPPVDTAVRFPAWFATIGNYSARCSVYMAGDVQPGNDAAGRSFVVVPMVPYHDAGCAMITAPAGLVDSGATVAPACSVYNYGNQTEDYLVRMIIGGIYEQTAPVTGHEPGTMVSVTFPDWQAQFPGSYVVTCSTELAGDTAYYNNVAVAAAEVVVRDAAVSAIDAPTGTILIGPVTPRARLRNAGSGALRAPCRAYFYIGDTTTIYYSDSVDIPGGLPVSDTTISFASWTAFEGESFFSRCSVHLAGDTRHDNDAKSGTFIVSGQLPGWGSKTPMPLFPSSKACTDGGWLTHNPGDNRIYAAKGYKQGDFYAYDVRGDSWSQRSSWPVGVEAKGPSKGAAACDDNNGMVYATKGNNTQGFWRYDAAGDSWSQKASVPLGPTNKKVKGGTSLVWVDNTVYMLKGYKDEFWRYFPEGDSWHQLPNAPQGVVAKWDKGSWIAYDAVDNLIYAHKAKFHEFYSFDPVTETWSAQGALKAMPTINSQGKSKKSKDGGFGAALGRSIFAFKGGNTQEFWQYDVASDSWTEKETIPQIGAGGSRKKKVKGGASITVAGSSLYAMKGNKCNELWRYDRSGWLDGGRLAGARDGVAASPMTTGDCRLSIAPNPLAGGFASLSYSLPRAGAVQVTVCDVAGRTVTAQTMAAGRSGSAPLDLRRLSAGVYLVKISSDSFSATQKLVLQR
jgi:hypothetical protein